jgi:sodium/proline symporter
MLGFIFNWLWLAPRLRRMSKENKAITVPDFLEGRVKDNGHIIRYVACGIIFLLMFTYVAAQLTAAGKAFRMIFNMDYRVGVVIGAGVTIFYTTVGGFKAVSWTDVVQGLLMMIGLIIIPIILILHIGGIRKLMEGLRKEESKVVFFLEGEIKGKWEKVRVDKEIAKKVTEKVIIEVKNGKCIVRKEGNERVEINGKEISEGERLLKVGNRLTVGEDVKLTVKKKLKLTGGEDLVKIFGGRRGLVLLGFLIGMLGIGLGYPGCPHVITRYMAAKGEGEIKRGRIIALIWGTVVYTGAILTGLACRYLFPAITDPDNGFLLAGLQFLHPIFGGIILAAVFAAIRSTADSQLLVASSSVVRDIGEKALGKEFSTRQVIKFNRIVVLFLGVMAVILAMTQARAIFWFVLFSWAGLGASFGGVMILSIGWKGIKKWGIVGGMISGFVTTVVWKLWLREVITKIYGINIYELVPAFLISILVTIVLSKLTK